MKRCKSNPLFSAARIAAYAGVGVLYGAAGFAAVMIAAACVVPPAALGLYVFGGRK